MWSNFVTAITLHFSITLDIYIQYIFNVALFALVVNKGHFAGSPLQDLSHGRQLHYTSKSPRKKHILLSILDQSVAVLL